MSTQRIGARGKRSSGALLILALGAAADGVALAGTARDAEVVFPGGEGKIVFSSDRTTGTSIYNPTGDFGVFTMNPNGTGLTQLTFNTADDYSPAFSADGRRVVFASDRVGDFESFVINASDGSAQQRLAENAADDRYPALSSDGKGTAFTGSRTKTTLLTTYPTGSRS